MFPVAIGKELLVLQEGVVLANEFVNFFHAVFQEESCGPLPASCFNLDAVSNNVFLSILPENVRKLLSEIDISKSFGIDAQIIGRVEPSEAKKLTIKSAYGTFEYE